MPVRPAPHPRPGALALALALALAGSVPPAARAAPVQWPRHTATVTGAAAKIASGGVCAAARPAATAAHP